MEVEEDTQNGWAGTIPGGYDILTLANGKTKTPMAGWNGLVKLIFNRKNYIVFSMQWTIISFP